MYGLGRLFFKYYKSNPTKDRGHDSAIKNKFNRQKKNNAIVNHALDEMILQENNKVSAEAGAYENIELKLTRTIYIRLII